MEERDNPNERKLEKELSQEKWYQKKDFCKEDIYLLMIPTAMALSIATYALSRV